MRQLSIVAVVVTVFMMVSTTYAAPRHHSFQSGIASWYGRLFHGKPTASGEPFNMFGLTAAHPFLPFGTLVKVTNLSNHRWVVVRITDRGPFVDPRVIDVSKKAAELLGFKDNGLAYVQLEIENH